MGFPDVPSDGQLRMTMGSRDFFWLRVSGGPTRVGDRGVVTVVRPRSVLDLLAGWLPRQRWYAGKGGGQPELARLGGLLLDDVLDEGRSRSAPVEVDVLFVQVTTPDGASVVYQVPLTLRAEPADELAPALVGCTGPGARGPVRLRRPARPRLPAGPAPPARGGGRGLVRRRGRRSGAPGAVRPVGGWANDPGSPAKVLGGEQSNTSIIVDADGERPIILKVFRVLAGGDNPDVVVQTALAAAGSSRVARPAGWIEGWWPVVGGKAPVHGHLVYACEFLPGSRDAWREATDAVAAGRPFTSEAFGLGAATAEVHTTLARALPSRPVDRAALDALADGLLARVDWACAP